MRNESLNAGELSKKLSKSLLLDPFVLARKFSARALRLRAKWREIEKRAERASRENDAGRETRESIEADESDYVEFARSSISVVGLQVIENSFCARGTTHRRGRASG